MDCNKDGKTILAGSKNLLKCYDIEKKQVINEYKNLGEDLGEISADKNYNRVAIKNNPSVCGLQWKRRYYHRPQIILEQPSCPSGVMPLHFYQLSGL